jgi:hypothetical protein
MRRDSQLIFISVTFGSILHFRKKIRAWSFDEARSIRDG